MIAVIRLDDAEDALTLGRALAGSRVDAIEVTMTVPGADRVIHQLRLEGAANVGAGTVRTTAELIRCIDAGAAFIVSPHTDPAIVEGAVARGVPVVPGALTPSEIVRAIDLGAAAVKVFPVAALGGVSYVRQIMRPLGEPRLLASGGIPIDEAADYSAAGARGVCFESIFVRREEIVRRDVDELRRSADAVIDRIAAGAGGPLPS